MAKVRVRHDTKKLFIDFIYNGERYREQTMLHDTARNRKMLDAVVQRLEAQILMGDFDYAEFFPAVTGFTLFAQRLELGAFVRFFR